MRIEVDKQLANVLSEIKTKEPTIYGRGHVETIRFLANYYRVHKPLQGLIDIAQDAILGLVDNMDQYVEASLTRVLPKVLALTFSSIMAMAADKTETSQTEALRSAPGSHSEDAEETPRAGLGERSTARGRRRATTQRHEEPEGGE